MPFQPRKIVIAEGDARFPECGHVIPVFRNLKNQFFQSPLQHKPNGSQTIPIHKSGFECVSPSTRMTVRTFPSCLLGPGTSPCPTAPMRLHAPTPLCRPDSRPRSSPFRPRGSPRNRHLTCWPTRQSPARSPTSSPAPPFCSLPPPRPLVDARTGEVVRFPQARPSRNWPPTPGLRHAGHPAARLSPRLSAPAPFPLPQPSCRPPLVPG